MFGTALVATRGEIALRIIRTCRGLGLRRIMASEGFRAGRVHTRFLERGL